MQDCEGQIEDMHNFPALLSKSSCKIGINEKIEKKLLERLLYTAWAHHESLRTQFNLVSNFLFCILGRSTKTLATKFFCPTSSRITNVWALKDSLQEYYVIFMCSPAGA